MTNCKNWDEEIFTCKPLKASDFSDCKNCKYTDEYCASGECTSQSPRNHLATTSQVSDLTEKWKKGEFIICNAGRCKYYYVQNEKQQEVIKNEYCLFDDNTPNWKILAPVPSYDEWKASYNCMLENEVLRLKNAQLKELLKEWIQFETEENPNDFTVMSERMSELANKTKEELDK